MLTEFEPHLRPDAGRRGDSSPGGPVGGGLLSIFGRGSGATGPGSRTTDEVPRRQTTLRAGSIEHKKAFVMKPSPQMRFDPST